MGYSIHRLKFLTLISFLFLHFTVTSQVEPKFMEVSSQKTYEIGSLVVKGNQFSDEKAIISISGLRIGQKISIPGPETQSAIKSLYKQRLFSNVEIILNTAIDQVANIEIHVKEKARYSKHTFKGVKKSAHDDLNGIVNSQLVKNSIISEDIKQNITNTVRDYYLEKGYLDAKVAVLEFPDEKKENSVRLVIDIEKGKRVKIANITFDGNKNVSDYRLRRKLDKTKRVWQIFSKSKLQQDLYEADKKNIVDYYHTIGYRDAKITSDSVWRSSAKRLKINLVVDEGKRYYHRNIEIKGNSLYKEEYIKNVLGVQKGDVYNPDLLQKRLSFSQDGRDVSSLYMDEGYLFFRAEPIEVGIDNDSVDIEIRIVEGPQATIDKVTIRGNDRTNEHVVRRELRTRPGQKFSRSDIIRSQRAIMGLGFFNPEALGINTPVNPRRGTVDIEYTVEEKPSDQLELSAGWSAFGLLGTLGVSFNNFSTRNILKRSAWSPLPQGDGQKLSLRAQTNGKYYQSYNFSFTEPWLGGKKPSSLTLGGVYSLINNESLGSGKFSILRFSASLGSQLRKPDDNFITSTGVNLERIRLKNYRGFNSPQGEPVLFGDYYNLSLRQTIARSTVNEPLFPRSGNKLSLTIQLTPPYSLFRKNWEPSDAGVQDRYRWVEYHKWRIDGDWFFNPFDKLVFAFNAKIGFLGYYNSKIGAPPFERTQLGGDGLNNQSFTITGRDIISMRGYEPNEINTSTSLDQPSNINNQSVDATVFNKYTVEMRYPLSLNPSATIYALLFAQGGNAWYQFKDFNPFDLKRSAGVGVRVFLPMFGLLGFNYGVGFDKPWLTEKNASWKEYAKFNLILGFEPE
ncbi:MAG: outer membrane protein assembly factor BamA [Saprospiraceae bacterium]|nr:outer membrane protein assembly factor BamA [Saprospiraceae bacterium]MBK9994162.1 outer membrane protein assembly factor BamA [Saprospiraceae bacterium]